MTDYAEVLEIELPRVMHEVIIGLLGDDAAGDPNTAPAEDPRACRVRIRGGFEAEVVVSATPALASRIARQMFEDELAGREPTEQDARDALREVTNIVAGNLKPLFGENHQLGLPEDLTNRDHETHAGQLARATIAHESGVLDVRVYTPL